MNYYEVLVTTNKYHGKAPLTYSSDQKLTSGQIVLVPIQRQQTTAIVYKTVAKPKFATKPITSVLLDTALPPATLKLLQWLQGYYPASVSNIANLFVPSDLLLKKANVSELKTKTSTKDLQLPGLTSDQKVVIAQIESSSSRSFLLHGITGSGKTRVYIELAQKVLRQNKKVLILTPEIGLTPQMSQMFTTSLEAEVLIVHSNLSNKQRRDIWLKILNTAGPQVIVGPRSSLFSPIANLGLVVADEFHDSAYKQEQSPYYHALRVAGALAAIHNAKFVYGSATPTVSEYYYAQQKHVPILKMDQLATSQSAQAQVTVINAKDRVNFSRSSFLSNQMVDTIQESFNNGEQSLVFLNRRGTARVVICQNCGWQALCPNCDLPLTYHGDSHLLRCHTCGFKQNPVTSCPVCASPDIIYKSIGTKALELQLKHLFPEARVSRFDNDNSKADRLDQHYSKILKGEVDILVGTQMLVKGLDLPRLSTVGVVAADSSLYFPDYTADEQTYQLLTQVIGRVARGHIAGKVVVQTYNPDGPPLKAAIAKDWDSFYEQQIAERQKFVFPPFCFLLQLTCSRKSAASAAKAAQTLADQIKSRPLKIKLLGPSPRFIEKAGGYFNWQIVIKAKQRSELIKIIDDLPANWHYDIDPISLL